MGKCYRLIEMSDACLEVRAQEVDPVAISGASNALAPLDNMDTQARRQNRLVDVCAAYVNRNLADELENIAALASYDVWRNRLVT